MPPTAGHSGGWTAAKLFEAGVRAGGTAGPVTVASVLAGLYTFKNETLGGLTAPLTFTVGQTAPRVLCTSQVVIKEHKWHLIDDGKFHCS
jgi:branched-chain amino acid transport system substrate-binding protein